MSPRQALPPATDDTTVLGKTSQDTIIPAPIVTGACGTTVPPAADRAKAAPTSGAQARKRPCIAARHSIHSCHATEVIARIELSPYRGPRSPLDVVTYEIVFGRIFEAFHRMSQCCDCTHGR
jgi:hypothetical protein